MRELGDSVGFYKVGKELFTAVGPAIVRDLVAGGKKCLSRSQIPRHPEYRGGRRAHRAALGVSLLTVHASGGSRMLQAAAEAAAQSEARPTVLAVTVLTSLVSDDLEELGVSGGVEAQVIRLAGLALRAGCGGIVASAQEAARLRGS